jgi:hypothetical protein
MPHQGVVQVLLNTSRPQRVLEVVAQRVQAFPTIVDPKAGEVAAKPLGACFSAGIL